MPLAPQNYVVDLTGGLAQHVDAKHLPPGSLMRLENGRAPKQAAIEKRPGNSDIGTVSGVLRLVSRGNELLAIDGTDIWSYSPTQATWTRRDKVSEATCTTSSFPAVGGGVLEADMASSGSMVVVVFRDQRTSIVGNIYVSVYDIANGSQILSDYQIGIGQAPRICLVGTRFFIVYSDFGGNIACHTYTIGGSVSSATNIRTDVTALNTVAIAVLALSSTWVLAYGWGVDVLKLASFSNAAPPVQQATVTPTGSLSPNSIAMAGTDGERIWLGIGTTRAKIATYNTTTLAEVLAPTNVGADLTNAVNHMGVVRLSSTTVGMVYTGSTAAGYKFTCAPVVNTSGAAVSGATEANRKTHHTRLAGYPFARSGKVYALLTTGVSTQLSHTLCDLGQDDTTTTVLLARPVARGPRRTAFFTDPGAATANHYATILPYGANSYITGAVNIRSANLNTAATRTGLARLTFDFADASRWTPAELGGVLHLSGGVPSFWDGARLADIGFEYFPDVITLTGHNTGTLGWMAAGTYRYLSVYGYIDETGAIHRSAPSASASVTVTGTENSVDLVIPCLTVSTRQDAASSFYPTTFIETYRTTANSSGPYYLINYATLGTGDLSQPANDPSAASISISDHTHDTAIVSNRQLYTRLTGTTEAVLENVCPPSSGGLIAHAGCLWSIGDDGTIWYTKARVDGEAMAFCDEFTLQWDETQPPTALRALDQNVVVFSRSRLYLVQGQTPSDSGVGGSLTGPTRLASDYGCSDGRSLVTIPGGIVFQTPSSIALLDRGLNVHPEFGWGIQDAIVTNPTITSAVVHPTGGYILLSAYAGSTTGARFYYDYISTQWGIDYLTGTVRATAAPISMAVVNGALYWADADGHIYQESTSSYLDAGSSWVTLLVETPEIKLSGLQGYQRVWKAGVLGKYYTGHDLTLKFATDYSANYAQTKTFAAATIAAWEAAGKPEQAQVRVVRQLCESIRVVVQDATPSSGSVGTGRGLSLASVELEVGVMPRQHRLRSAQQG